MKIQQIWRFPVKSMGGERVEAAAVDDLGIEGDRRWGIRDLSSGKVLTAKRDGRLLMASARYLGPGRVVITLPTGEQTDRSEDIANWLGRDVCLEQAGESGGQFENPRDYEAEDDWVSWQGPPGAWHDMKRARVSLVSQATLGEWDVRRFRANLIVDGSGEDELVGTSVTVGSVALTVTKKIDRCVMVTRAQPGLERDLDVLKVINRDRGTFLSVGTLVQDGGRISIGDEVLRRPD